MRIDSTKFDIRQMNSGTISTATPLEIGQCIVPYLEDLIMAMPEEEALIELRIRSVVNILIVAKLQSDKDRSELEEAKEILANPEELMNINPLRLGKFDVLNIGRWTLLSLAEGGVSDTKYICDNLSEVFHNAPQGRHYILDFSRMGIFDFRLAAYLVGFQGMLSSSGRKMSIAWLPRTAITGFSDATHDSIMSKFKFYKKGSFLISQESETV